MRVLVVLLSFVSSIALADVTAPASFRQDWRRYPSADMLVRQWARYFPFFKVTVVNDDCHAINETNRGFLGFNGALTGQPEQPDPGVAFVAWRYSCLQLNSTRLYSDLMNPTVDVAEFLAVQENARAWWAGLGTRSWAELSLAEKKKLLSDLFENTIAPFDAFEGLVEGFDRVTLIDRLAGEMDQVVAGTHALNTIVYIRGGGVKETYILALSLFALEDLMMY